MKVLTLSLKQQYFDEIVAGTKMHEYREIRPKAANRYIQYVDANGKVYAGNKGNDIPEDIDFEAEPIQYDAIKFLTGAYSGKRPYIIVEVKDAQIVYIVDENNNPRTFDYEGEEYLEAEIDYTLGEIIERSNY